MSQKLKDFILFYGLLLLLFVPASFKIFPIQNEFANSCFGWLIASDGDFSSDSQGLAKLILLLLFISLFLVGILNLISSFRENRSKFHALIKLIIIYYLASRFFVYGFDKLVKSQFFMPEPNTLYTPVGMLSKDILYWTSMGTSYWFNVLTGCLEIVPAIFLLFKKTRVIGLIILLYVIINVLIINIGFDISVKMYSFVLLLLILTLLAPNIKSICMFLVGKSAQLKPEEQTFQVLNKPFMRTSVKCFVIGLILLDMAYYSIQSGNFNDDLVKRPTLHGAYQVNHENVLNVKRFFIHRRGFFILQYQNDEFIDYKLNLNEFNLILTDYTNEMYQVPYKLNSGQLEINLEGEILKGDELDWKNLPVLKDEFNLFYPSH